MDNHELLKKIPSVDEVLSLVDLKLKGEIPHQLIVDSIREEILNLRSRLIHNEKVELEELDPQGLATSAGILAKRNWRPNFRPVINATGVVIHTNLGRAVLGLEARAALEEIIKGYGNLELDLETGERGSRYSHVVDLLCKLTGAEAALVVNNNAAAVLLALNTLAKGREVIVSRGQLVEIGGSFRIPEVMTASGCELVEVGTTNKTHLKDYQGAITENTSLLLKVHPSNYRIFGFSQEVSLKELVELGREKGIPVMEDLGSGSLIDLSPYGFTDEPTVQEEIAAGADVITFSGDKLLGGPQGGLIVGKKKYIDLMAKNQLTRALRVDKLTLCALEATLKAYLWKTDEVIKKIPTLKMLTARREDLREKAFNLKNQLEGRLSEDIKLEIEEGNSRAGGGALPMHDLPTLLVTITPSPEILEKWAYQLRQGEPAVMVRLKEGKILLDLRTVLEEEIEPLVDALVNTLPH